MRTAMKNLPEVLITLAERVMGRTILAWDDDREFDLKPDKILVCSEFTEKSLWFIEWTDAGWSLKSEWNPWTNNDQALGLLEAWLGLGEGRWYEHEGLRQNLHRVYLFVDFPKTDPCSGEATTFSKAAFDAVCAAEGIRVKE